MLLVPTVLQNYLIAEVEAEEKATSPPTWDKNTLSGRFTNFVNLLDMAAISVPSAILQSPDLRKEASETGQAHAKPLMPLPFKSARQPSYLMTTLSISIELQDQLHCLEHHDGQS